MAAAVCCAVLCLWASPNVWAHNNNAAGIRPLFSTQGELVGAATSIGLLRHDDDKLRLFGGYPGDTAWSGVDASGRVLVGGVDGIYTTADWGCTWHRLEGVLGHKATSAAAWHPEQHTLHVIATASPDGDNALYRSDDGGQTWSPLDTTHTTGWFTSVVWVREAARYVAISVGPDGAEPYTLHIGDADALSWSSLPLELPEGVLPRVLTGLEDGRSVLLAALTPSVSLDPATGLLAMLAEGGDDLLWTVDLDSGGTVAWTATTSGAAPWLSAVLDSEGTLWLTDETDILYRYRAEDEAIEPLFPQRACVFENPTDGQLWLCGERPDAFVFYASPGGDAWEGTLPFADIVLAQCDDSETEDDGSTEETPNGEDETAGSSDEAVHNDSEAASGASTVLIEDSQGAQCTVALDTTSPSRLPWWSLGWAFIGVVCVRRLGRT